MSQAPVLLVGGSDLFRRGLRGFLEGTAFEAVGEFTRYQDCVAAAGDAPAPALIVYVSSGVIEETASAVDALLGAYDAARLLLLSSKMSVEELGACLRMGARGYLLNTISKDALIHSLALIGLGETVFPSDLAHALMSGGEPLADTAEARKLGGPDDARGRYPEMPDRGAVQQADRPAPRHPGSDREDPCEVADRQARRREPDPGGALGRPRRRRQAVELGRLTPSQRVDADRTRRAVRKG